MKKIGNNQFQKAISIAIDTLSNIYITGHFKEVLDFDPSSNTANLDAGNTYDIFLAKYTTDGNFSWVRSIEGEQFNYGEKVVVDKNNSPVISGRFRGEINLNPFGNPFYLNTQSNNTDILIASYNEDGELKTAKKIGGNDSEEIYGFNITENNNLLLCGYFRNKANLNTNEPAIELVSVNSADAFAAMYSMCDNFYIPQTTQSCGPYTAFNCQTFTESGIYDIALNSFLPDCDTIYRINLIVTEINTEVTLNNSTLTATYEEYNTEYQWYNCADNQPIADATNQSFTPTANGSYQVKITNGNCDEFSECVDVTNVSVSEIKTNLIVNVYPSPTSGYFEVNIANSKLNVTVELYDLIGNKIESKNTNNTSVVSFNLNNHAAGVYLIKVYDESVLKTFKVVKQ